MVICGRWGVFSFWAVLSQLFTITVIMCYFWSLCVCVWEDPGAFWEYLQLFNSNDSDLPLTSVVYENEFFKYFVLLWYMKYYAITLWYSATLCARVVTCTSPRCCNSGSCVRKWVFPQRGRNFELKRWNGERQNNIPQVWRSSISVTRTIFCSILQRWKNVWKRCIGHILL